jgi:hypothetical protein
MPGGMNNSISKAAYPGPGHCSVCGLLRKLEMWDLGLNGRFCAECFDHVVDSEESSSKILMFQPVQYRRSAAANCLPLAGGSTRPLKISSGVTRSP